MTPGEIVPAAAYGNFQTTVSRKFDCVSDLLGGRAAGDDRWVPIDGAVEDGARLVVVDIFGCDHLAGEFRAKLVNRCEYLSHGYPLLYCRVTHRL